MSLAVVGSGDHIAILDDELIVDPRHVGKFVEQDPRLVEVLARVFVAFGRVETLVGSRIVKEGGAKNHLGLAGGGGGKNARNTAGVAASSLAERVAIDGDTLFVALGIPLRDVVEYCSHFGLDCSVAVEIMSP